VGKWSDFFTSMKAMLAAPANADTLDNLKKSDWEAHTASIHTSLALFQDQGNMLPDMEATAAYGWASFVEFIGEARMDASFRSIADLQPMLPQRRLKMTDSLVALDGLTDFQKMAVRMFGSLKIVKEQCPTCFSTLFKLWQTVCADAPGRDLARQMMASAMKPDLPAKVAAFAVDADTKWKAATGSGITSVLKDCAKDCGVTATTTIIGLLPEAFTHDPDLQGNGQAAADVPPPAADPPPAQAS